MSSGFDFSQAPQLIEVSLTAGSALLNGLAAFVSPCILPMLPVYAAYLLGEGTAGQSKHTLPPILFRMLGFLLGFIPFFMALGAGAGALGPLLQSNPQLRTYIGGGLMIVFGLMMLDVLPALNIFHIKADGARLAAGGFFKTALFGILLAISWLSCTSPFLFNVLLLAAKEGGTAAQGIWLLFLFSLGLAAPFLLFMVLYAKLGAMIAFLRNHQLFIRRTAGVVMIILGILQIAGLLK